MPELQEMRSFHKYLPSYENQHACVGKDRCVRSAINSQRLNKLLVSKALDCRSHNSKKCPYSIHICQIIRTNTMVRVRVDLSEVLFSQRDSRNYENPEHCAADARLQTNAIISYILYTVLEATEVCHKFIQIHEFMRIQTFVLPMPELQEMLSFHRCLSSYENQRDCASKARYVRSAINSQRLKKLLGSKALGCRSHNSKECQCSIHVRQIIRINAMVRARVDLSEVLFFIEIHESMRTQSIARPRLEFRQMR